MSDEALLDAATDGDLDAVRQALEDGADINAHAGPPEGETALHTAAANGAMEIIELLIERGAKLDGTNNYGDTPLHSAAANEQTEAAKRLIEAGANALAKNKNDETPFSQAVENGRLEMAEFLIANGGAGEMPEEILHTAVKSGEADMVRLLLAQKVDVNRLNGNGETPLAGTKSVELANLLLESGADPNLGKPLPLERAAAAGKADLMAALLARGADVKKGHPLHSAAKFARKAQPVIELLLAAGADRGAVDEDGLTPAECSEDDAIRVLLGGTPAPKVGELDVEELEEAYGKPLPLEYRDFIASGRYQACNGKSFALPTYGKSANVWFSRRELTELMDDGDDFQEDVSSFIPLASIYVGEDHREPQFLVLDVKSGKVLMFEHEKSGFIAVAESLTEFLAD